MTCPKSAWYPELKPADLPNSQRPCTWPWCSADSPGPGTDGQSVIVISHAFGAIWIQFKFSIVAVLPAFPGCCTPLSGALLAKNLPINYIKLAMVYRTERDIIFHWNSKCWMNKSWYIHIIVFSTVIKKNTAITTWNMDESHWYCHEWKQVKWETVWFCSLYIWNMGGTNLWGS